MNPTFTVSIDLEKRKTSVTGLVAVGEKVNVVISGIDLSTIPEWEADNDEGFIGPALRFRLVTSTGKDLVRFPLADGDKWTVEGNSLSAEVDFNTMQLREWLHSFPIDGKAEVGIIVDSVVDAMEYGRGSVKILQWAASPAEDPTILPDWRKTLRELNEAIVEISYKSEQAVNAATSAESAKELARDSANSANVAANNAVKSENEAKGFRNESLTAADNASAFANNAKASQTAAENAKNAAESARDEAKGYAESAASTLANAATKAELQAEVDRAIAAERDNALVIGEVSKTLMDEMDRAKAADNNLESQITGIGNKVDDLVADDKSKSVRTIAAEEVAKVIAGADTNYDTLKEIADYIKEDATDAAQLKNKVKNLENTKADVAALEDEMKRAKGAEESLGKAIDTKVDAVEGMGLSSNDYTNEEKEKLGKAYTPDNPPPPPDLSDYPKTEEVESALEGKVARGENLFAYGEDGYPISPDLFTFYGQSAPGVAIYGAVGLDGFTMERMATNFVGAIKIDFDSYSGVPRILLDDSYGGGLVLDSRHIKTNTVQANHVAGVGDLGVEGVQNIQFSPDSAISYYKDDGNFLNGPVPPLVDMANGSYYGESFYFGGNLKFGSKAPSFKFEPGPGGVYDKSLYLTDIYDAVYGYTFIRYGENYDIETEDENSLAFTIVGYDDGSSFECSLGSRVIGFSNKFVGTAYLSWSGLGIYDYETRSSMTLSASSIGFWDAENGTDLILSLDEFRAVKNAMPRYPFVDAAIVEGVVTVAPYSNAKLVSDGTAFSVAVGAGDGQTRDCVLCVECGETAPKITWPTNFHPRTDKDTDFACVAGVRNVYWITEYSQGEFVVACWQETEGGNAE